MNRVTSRVRRIQRGARGDRENAAKHKKRHSGRGVRGAHVEVFLVMGNSQPAVQRGRVQNDRGAGSVSDIKRLETSVSRPFQKLRGESALQADALDYTTSSETSNRTCQGLGKDRKHDEMMSETKT